MTSNGHALEGPKTVDVNLVMQEICRRTFEVMFASARSLQQHGVSQWDLPIPPATKSEPYPPLPMEVDDAHRRTTTPNIVSLLESYDGSYSNASQYFDSDDDK